MGRVADLRKQLNSGSSSDMGSTGKANETLSERMARIKKSGVRYEVDEDYIKRFAEDVNSYFKDDNSREELERRKSDLNNRANYLRSYINSNASNMDKYEYEDLKKYLDNWDLDSRYAIDNQKLKELALNKVMEEEKEPLTIEDIETRINDFHKGGGDDWLNYHNDKTGEVMSAGDFNRLLGQRDRLVAQQRIDARRQKLDDEYGQLSSRDDFASNTGRNNYTNVRQNLDAKDEENNYLGTQVLPDKLGAYLGISQAEKDMYYIDSNNGEVYGQTFDGLMKEASSKYWDRLDKNEIDIYYYLMNTQGKEAAYKFLDDMETELGLRNLEKMQGEIAEADTLKMIGYNIASIPANVYGGAAAFVSDAINMLHGKEINPYDAAHETVNWGSIVRGQTAENIDNTLGKEKIPYINFGWGEAYQALMSGADSLLGAATMGEGYTVIMGMNAAQAQARNLYEKGASNEQIALGALTSGVAEGLFEKVSLDKFLSTKSTKTKLDWVKQVLSQAGVEASEEMATEITNTITDALIMRGNSEWAEAYEKGGFMDAFNDTLGKVLSSGLGGALSGGAMAAGGSTLNLANYNLKSQEIGKDIQKKGTVDKYVDQANSMKDNDVVQMALAKVRGIENINDTENNLTNKEYRAIGKLVDTVYEAMDQSAVNSEIKAQLEKEGIDASPEEVAKIRKYLESDADIKIADEKTQMNAEKLTQDSERYGEFVSNINSRIVDNAIEMDTNYKVKQAYKDRISDNGTTVLVETGEEIKPTTIASIEDGKLMLNTESGSVVDSDDIKYKDYEMANKYETLKALDIPTELGNYAIQVAEQTDMGTTLFNNNVALAYNYGLMNESRRLDSLSIPDDLKNQLFEAGRKAAESKAKAGASNFANKNIRVSKTSGVTFVNDIDTNKLNANQKTTLAVAKFFAKSTNYDVRLFESYKKDGVNYATIDGVERAEDSNGWFVEGSNIIYIDINAGNNYEGLGFLTIGHESGHAIREANAEAWKNLADAIVEEIDRQAEDDNSKYTFEELWSQKLAKYKKFKEDGRKDYVNRTNAELEDMAYEDVVCDSLSSLMTDVETFKMFSDKLKAKDEGAWARIKSAIKNFIKKLDKLIKSISSRAEGEAANAILNATVETRNRIRELYVDAFLGANENIGKAIEKQENMSNEEAFEDSETFVMNQIRTPYTEGTNAWKEFINKLDAEAKATHDMFYNFYTLSKLTNVKNMQGNVVKKLNISSVFMTAQQWNEKISTDLKWKKCAIKLAESLPDNVRKNMRFNLDGTLTTDKLEDEFKMSKSLAQRLVDSLGYEKIDANYLMQTFDKDGNVASEKTINLPNGGARQSVGGESYRRALISETRKLFAMGKLSKVKINTLSKDRWGSLGFLAANSKTTASGDLTTLCPQMMFNKGCFYCYRRAALETGLNNKLVAQSVWYTGEILRIKDSDIKALNENGGLRIQSFGDWMPHFSAQLADILYDAELRGLQVKIITKEPSMIEYISSLREQGIGKNLYFNLSADYVIEKGPANINNIGNESIEKPNPERPFVRDENNQFWWKRALAVKEAYDIRNKHPWVNVRIVATDVKEFIRGLADPMVQVVTGYHGALRNVERIDSTTGKSKVEVEPLGDAGMPRFAFVNGEWVREFDGKTKYHKSLADAIEKNGLQYEYYIKTCCITGRCATCVGKCGKLADSFTIKNATNIDSESVEYWEKHMTKAEKELDDSIEAPGVKYSGRYKTDNYYSKITPATREEAKGMKIIDERNVARYRMEIDDAFSGKMSEGFLIMVGNPTELLTKYGVPKDTLYMSQSIARKIAYPLGYKLGKYETHEVVNTNGKHNLGMSALKNLPLQIYDPIAITNNNDTNKGKSIIVWSNWVDELGRGIMLGLAIGNDTQNGIKNGITTVFQANEKYANQFFENEDDILYTKNNKDIKQLLSTRRHMPVAKSDDIFIKDYNKKYNNVKESVRVTDEETLSFLNKQLRRGEITEVYRAMAVDGNGRLFPPMAGYVRENGKKVLNGTPSEFGVWEQSTESIPWDNVDEEFLVSNGYKEFKPNKDFPNGRFEKDDLIFYKNKRGDWKAKFRLNKDNGSEVPAAYAPYIHTSLSMLNDQFTSAYTRPNLVVVKGYVPNSEVNGVDGVKYKANFAEKSVGETTWHSGVVAADMPESRRVILSRYFMPIEIIDDKDVAKSIKAQMKGKDIEIPFNVVTPNLRKNLEAIGVRIGDSRGLKQKLSKDSVKYSDRDNIGYHAGDLGKSEPYGSQSYGRDTGHFGTGTYFVGNQEKIKNYNKRDGKPAPVESVDFGKYNLYRPMNNRDADRLHEALKVLDGKIIEPEWIEHASNGEYSLVNGYGWLDLITEKYGEEYDEDLGFYTTSREAYEGDNYINAIKEYADSVGVEYDSLEEFIENNPEEVNYYTRQYEKGYGSEGESLEEYTNYFMKNRYKDYLTEQIKATAEDINKKYHEFYEAYNDLLFTAAGLSRERINNAMHDVAEYIESIKNKSSEEQYRSDSVATVFMKALGYEGVDVRHLDDYDNTTYGSVIYDLKDEDLARKQEIGTARFSDRDSEGNELSEGQIEYFKDSKVRDKDGNLLRMYHGTRSEFFEFDKKKIGSSGAGRFEGNGFNFTPSKSRASGYAGGVVMEGYINIENPLSAETKTLSVGELAKVIAQIDPTGDDLISNYYAPGREGYGTPEYIKKGSLETARAIWDYCENDVDIYSQLSSGGADAEALINWFENKGYDGLIHYYDDGSIKTVIAFESNQFKDIDNTNPTENPDRRYSIREIEGVSGTNYGKGVYLDSTFLDGLDDSERIELFRAYVDELGGQSFVGYDANGRAIDINIVDGKVYTDKNGKRTKGNYDLKTNHRKNKIKQEVISLIDEVISTANQTGIVKNTHTHGWIDDNAQNDWNYFVTFVMDKNNDIYSVVLNTTTSDVGDKILYDITKIKLREQGVTPPTSPSSNIIEDEDSGVNTNSERNPEASTRFLLSNGLYDVAMNDAERDYIGRYQKHFEKYDGYQKELDQVKSEIREISFGKGKRDKDRLIQLKNKAEILAKKINDYDKKLLKLEATKPIQQIIDRERSLAKKKADEAGRLALKEYKEKVAENKRLDMIARRERAARLREQKGNTDIRNRIKNLVAQLSSREFNPKVNKYIPEELIKPVSEILSAINLDSGRSERLTEQLATLKVKYDEMANNPKYSIVYDEVVSEMVQGLIAKIGNTSIYDMNREQLEATYTTLKALMHTIKDAIKVKNIETEKNAFEIAAEMQRETSAVKRESSNALVRWLNTSLRPETMFERFAGFKKDSMWHKVYEMLNRGQQKKMMIEMEANKIFDKVFSNEKYVKSLSDTKNLLDVGLKDDNGEPVLITKGMALAIYRGMLNEDNLRHMMIGGITVPDIAKYYKGSDDAYGVGHIVSHGVVGRELLANSEEISEVKKALKEAKEGGDEESIEELKKEIADLYDKRNKIMSDGNLEMYRIQSNIAEHLTTEDYEFLKATAEFFDVYSKRVLNATTMELYGFEKAQVENYLPIHTDPNFRQASFEQITKDFNLENSGFMKDRVKASNPIMLEDLAELINSQIGKIATYSGFTGVVRDFNKIYGKTEPGYMNSLQNTIASKFGTPGKKYIENLMSDIVGSRSGETTFLDRARGYMAGATLSVNPRVALAQAASYPTAASELGWGALAKASGKFFSTQDLELIAKYTPLLYNRSKGTDIEVADIKKMSQAQNRVMRKLNWLMGWIEAIDKRTVGTLWYASQYYVDDNFKNLSKGSDEYYMKVAEVFNKVVERTQPNYTTLQRPDILRNPNALVKQLTMFMTQRLQNFNIVYESAARFAKYSADSKKGINGITTGDVAEARQDLIRSVGSQLVAGATIVGMKFLVDAIMHSMNAYRDDDKELTPESIGTTLMENMLDTVMGNFLGGSELFAILDSVITKDRYYGISVNGVDAYASAIEDFVSLTQSPSLDKANELAKAVCTFLGIPLGNVEKIGLGIYNQAIDIANGDFGSFESGVERTNKQKVNVSYNAMNANDTSKSKEVVNEMIKSYTDKGKTEKEAKSSVRSSITSRFKSEYQAAYKANDTNKMYQIRKYLQSTGVYDDVAKTCQTWIQELAKK